MNYIDSFDFTDELHIGSSQRLWNQKTVYEGLCCDCSEMTSQLFNFPSQNLSLVQSLFSGIGQIPISKKENAL